MSRSLADGTPEIAESAEAMLKHAKRTAALIRKSRHIIAFTGAGISTAAGIPDFRGPNGVWTRKDKGLPAPQGTPMQRAKPTYTHRALKALVDAGILKQIVSQNVDGLHLRSGVPRAQMSELHGNTYLAKCWGCGHEQLCRKRVAGIDRSRVCRECRPRVPHFCHCAALPPCPGCGKALKDSIIHFGENLPEKDLTDAFAHAAKADLCIVLGSSCKVTPAADVPETVGAKAGESLVIVNLQPTPLDSLASVISRSKIDAFMAAVMEQLGMEVPEPEPEPEAEPATVAMAAVAGGAAGSAAAEVVGGASTSGAASRSSSSVATAAAVGAASASAPAAGAGGGAVAAAATPSASRAPSPTAAASATSTGSSASATAASAAKPAAKAQPAPASACSTAARAGAAAAVSAAVPA